MGKAVIFDLDGTLADTLADIAAAVNRSLAGRGFPAHPTDDFRLMVGDGFRLCVTRALPEAARSDGLIEELRAEAAAYYEAHAVVSTKPYPGIPELLATLEARGLPTAVLSNKPDRLCGLVVAGLFPDRRFALVRGESPAFPRKPDPASALDIAARLGLEPADVVYLGDSGVDMATARSAGMAAIGAGWGYRGAGELRSSGAGAVISRPEELLGFL